MELTQRYYEASEASKKSNLGTTDTTETQNSLEDIAKQVLLCRKIMEEQVAEIKRLLAEYTEKRGKDKTFTGGMFYIMAFLARFQDFQGANVNSYNNINKLESTLRTDFSTAQSGFNAAMSGKDPQEFIQELNTIETFLEGDDAKAVLDPSLISSTKQYIDNIKNALGSGGDSAEAAKKIAAMVEAEKAGNVSEGLKTILNAFTGSTQALTSVSQLTTAYVEGKAAEYKSSMATFKSTADSAKALNEGFVRNQRSG